MRFAIRDRVSAPPLALVAVAALGLIATGCGLRPAGEARRAQPGFIELANVPTGTTQVSVVEVRPVEGAAKPTASNAPAQGTDSQLGAPEKELTEVRQAFGDAMRQRVEKLDARVNEVTSKANAAGARTRSAVTTDHKAYAQQREAIVNRLGRLGAVPGDRWVAVADEIEQQVDDAEGLVDRMGGQLP